MTGSFPAADHPSCLAFARSDILTNAHLGVTPFWDRTPRNISLASFRYHFYKPLSPKPAPSDARSSASPDHQFLPVTILPDPILSSTASQPHLELILSNGRRIAVAPGFDTQTLRRLIAVVEERPCSD